MTFDMNAKSLRPKETRIDEQRQCKPDIEDDQEPAAGQNDRFNQMFDALHDRSPVDRIKAS